MSEQKEDLEEKIKTVETESKAEIHRLELERDEKIDLAEQLEQKVKKLSDSSSSLKAQLEEREVAIEEKDTKIHEMERRLKQLEIENGESAKEAAWKA